MNEKQIKARLLNDIHFRAYAVEYYTRFIRTPERFAMLHNTKTREIFVEMLEDEIFKAALEAQKKAKS